MPASSQKRWYQILFFIVAWCVALELLTRLFLVSPSNIMPDPRVGYMYQPNSTALIESADAGFRRVSFNELGLNDWPIMPEDHRPRVLVLGDSYVEAFQVARAQNFLGEMGRDRPDLRFVNGGRSGLDPVTEFTMFQKLAPLVHPSEVILVVNYGDQADMMSDQLTVSRCKGGLGICDFGMPPLAQPYRKGLAGLVSGRSALLTYLFRRFSDTFQAQLRREKDWLSQSVPSHAGARSPAAYSAEDFDSALTLVFRRITHRYKLIVMAVPNIDFEPGRKSRVDDGGAFERSVQRASSRAGAVFFDSGPALMAAYAHSGQPPRGFDFDQPGSGHLNIAGHAAVAHGLEKHLGIFAQKFAG